MFNYLKIGLLALLSMGSLLAMELPEKPDEPLHNAKSICFVDDKGNTITLSHQALVNAESLYFSCQDFLEQNSIEIAPELFAKLAMIKDFLNFHEKNQEALRTELNKKDNEALTAIVDAANTLDAKIILEAAINLLAERLNSPEMQDEYLKKGSHNLSLNVDMAYMAAQKMEDQKPIMLPFLLHKQIEKHGKVPCTILEGHTELVNSVCMSKSGEYIISGSADNTIRVWDMQISKCIRTLESGMGEVHEVCISNDGRYIVSGSADHTIRIWDMQTGKCIRTSGDHAVPIYSVCVSHDGKYIISASYDHTIRIWDMQTGKCIRILEGHTDGVIKVCMSKDNKYIISGSWDKTIRIWDMQTGECIRTLEGHTAFVVAICMSNDGKNIISGSSDKTIRVWDMQTGECVHILQGHNIGEIYSVCISEDGKYIISGSDDKKIRIWDMQTGECIRTLEGHTNSICSVCVSEDGKIISGSEDYTIRIWDIADPLLAEEYKKNLTPEKVTAMRVYCAGK